MITQLTVRRDYDVVRSSNATMSSLDHNFLPTPDSIPGVNLRLLCRRRSKTAGFRDRFANDYTPENYAYSRLPQLCGVRTSKNQI